MMFGVAPSVMNWAASATLLGALALGVSALPDSRAWAPVPCVRVGSSRAVPTDAYGGLAGTASRTGTGFFRTEKIGRRWVLLTPEGNPFWMVGVYHVDTGTSTDDLGGNYADRILKKYGDKYKWGEQTVRRLKAWGFNTLAEYSTWYVLPTRSPYGDWSNPEKMPLVGLLSPAYYSLRNTFQWADEPVKDLVNATDSHYHGYRASSPDVWDPNFAMWLENALGQDPHIVAILNSPWLAGIVVDDTDFLWGFGAGTDFPTEPAGNANAHLGWIILVTPPQQTVSAKLGVTYRDTRVYSKYALRDFLVQKYGDIASLNCAWGSDYTTFDSAGGWPGGRGLLDENGKGAWVGTDSHELRDTASAVKADLDDFLLVHARKYFSTVKEKLKVHAAAHLYLGPTVIGSWRVPPRRQILRAAGEYVDVIQTHYSGSQETLDFIATHAGDVPIISWEGATANPDSAVFRYPGIESPIFFRTQTERGQFYRAQVQKYFFRTVTATGNRPIVGIKFWEFADNWGEKANWGLVTFSDNAYDGLEASTRRGVDKWSYSVGGEERDYGNFLGAVRKANSCLLHRLNDELNALPREAERPAAVAGSAPKQIQ